MAYGYVVNCIKPSCGKPYRKNSNNSYAGLCPDCLKLEKKATKRKPIRSGSDLIGSQMHHHEMRIEKLEQDASMMYEILEDEIRKNMREMCREIIEAYLYESKEEYKQGLKNIRTSFRTETRKLKKEFEESLMEKIGKDGFIENEIKSYTKELDERFFKMHGQLATINSRTNNKFDLIKVRFPQIFGDDDNE
tara:strand:+ start:425 stop:1000 length:576 start_codon:yes stop_codon:yes gene_type:complete